MGRGGSAEAELGVTGYVLTVKHATITERLGRLTPEATDRVAGALAHLVGV